AGAAARTRDRADGGRVSEDRMGPGDAGTPGDEDRPRPGRPAAAQGGRGQGAAGRPGRRRGRHGRRPGQPRADRTPDRRGRREGGDRA
ncbi:hypothetical protein LTR94_037481, partial [Friedmanniomyces endolithicus]